MKKLLVTVIWIGLTGLNCTNAQTGEENLDSFIQKKADAVYKKESPPGIFVGILNNGQKSFFNAGYAVPDKQMSFDSSTIFEIGSITKTFTAYVLTAVLLENRIADTDLILKYLPDSVQENKNIENISFLSLMNHTSGLPRLPDNMNPANGMQPYEDYSANDLFMYLKKCIPKPDGKSNYSNLGAGIAGMLAERITGKSYAELVDQYIFLPFKMELPDTLNTLSNNKSQGYFDKTAKSVYWNMNVLTPAGGLKCSGTQMLTYLQNMCFPESDKSKAIISKLTTQTVSLNPQVAVGLGWHILNIKNQEPVYWHNGGTYGFSTFCAFLKDKSKAIMVVINQFNKNALCDGLGFTIFNKLISEE